MLVLVVLGFVSFWCKQWAGTLEPTTNVAALVSMLIWWHYALNYFYVVYDLADWSHCIFVFAFLQAVARAACLHWVVVSKLS